MKLYLGELRPMVEVLPVVLEKVTGKTGYWLGRAFTHISSEFASFEQARIALVNKYAARDDDGKLILNDEGTKYEMDDEDALNKEFDELAGQEIEIKYEPVSISALGDEVTGTEFVKLGRLIKDDEEE